MAYDDKFDVHNLYELKVLEQVEDSPHLTNRMVKDKLGVSIRLAHQVLSRMVKKGLMHVKKRNARRWDYFLTPQGIAEKTRLTKEFLQFSMHFYHEARRRSAQVCRDLAEADQRRVAFLGATELAEICQLGVQEWRLQVVDVFDDNGRADFLGLPVRPTSALAEAEADAVIVCLYDPAMPMREHHLPDTVEADVKFHWIF